MMLHSARAAMGRPCRRVRRGARTLWLWLLALPLAAGGLRAQVAPSRAPTVISLQQAVALARENNPAFQQQRNDVGVARSSVRSAYGDLLPGASASTAFGYTAPGEVRYGTEVLSAQSPESYFSQYRLGVSYQLDGNALLQPSVQRSQLRATERRVSGAAAALEAQVAQQYLTVLQAREQAAQAEREVARTDEHLRLAQARLEVGAGTPLEVRRAEVQKGRAEVGLVQFRNRAATAALMLGQLIGMPLDPAVELSSEFALFDPDWSTPALVEMALQNNPVLLAARASAGAAGTSVKAARTSYLPSLNLSMGWSGYVNQYGTVEPLVARALGGLDYEGCMQYNRVLASAGEPPQPCLNPSDPAVQSMVRQRFEERNRGFPFDFNNQPWAAQLMVSLPLFTGFDRQLQVDRAKAQAADARYQVRAEELRLQQEVATAVRNLETAYETARLQEMVVAAATEELRLAQERFRFGAASSVEVTDAQTTLAQAERDRIEAVYSFHQSLAALEALVGRSLRER